MRILCIVKRVPDSKAVIKPVADGSAIDPAGLRFVTDPFDEFGVEQAVRLREGRADVTEIVALAVGPADSAEVLRTALAMGADRAVLVPGEAFAAHDEIMAAGVLAAAVGKLGGAFDVIFCGKQAIDNDAGELGPALAELLDVPHVGAVTKLEVAADGKSLRANRRIEGAEEVVEVMLPALVTCEKGLVEPRHPALPKLMKAKKQPVETVVVEGVSGSGGMKFERMSLPPGRPACRFIEGSPEEMAKDLARRLRDEAKVL